MNTVRRTIKEWLEELTGKLSGKTEIETPRLDAEILLSESLSCSRLELFLRKHEPVEFPFILESWIARRQRLEPISYIIGHREFYKSQFLVSPAVLDPRPETEGVVERALEVLASNAYSPSVSAADRLNRVRVLDMGCGSGCIGLSIALERLDCFVTLVDLSKEALSMAELNAQRLGVQDRCDFVLGDAGELGSWQPLELEIPFDVIVANPPYIWIEDEEVASGVREFEPELALFAKESGLREIRRWLTTSSALLKSGGVLVMEIGARQGDSVLQLAKSAGLKATIDRDLSGRDRYVLGQKDEIRNEGKLKPSARTRSCKPHW